MVVLAGCKFDTARPFTWSYNATLTCPVAANQQQEYFALPATAAFEFPPPGSRQRGAA